MLGRLVTIDGGAHGRNTTLGYGLGVLVGAAGLILALAVNVTLAGIDLVMVGWILALAGLVIVILTAAQDASRRRRGDRSF